MGRSHGGWSRTYAKIFFVKKSIKKEPMYFFLSRVKGLKFHFNLQNRLFSKKFLPVVPKNWIERKTKKLNKKLPKNFGTNSWHFSREPMAREHFLLWNSYTSLMWSRWSIGGVHIAELEKTRGKKLYSEIHLFSKFWKSLSFSGGG